MQEARAQTARPLADTDLHDPIAGRGRKRIEPRQVGPGRHDAQQVAGFEPRQAPPAKPSPWSGIRWRRRCDEPKDRGRCLGVGAIIDPFGEYQLVGFGARGDMDEGQGRADGRPEHCPPLGKVLGRLAVDQPEIRDLGPAETSQCRIDLGGISAETRKAAIAEAQHSHRNGRGMRQPSQEGCRRGGRISIAMGRCQYQQAATVPVAAGLIVHCRHMNAMAGAGQGGMKGRRKAPSAVAFTSDEDDRVGRLRADIPSDPRHRAATAPPDCTARHGKDGRSKGRQSEKQRERPHAPARVEHEDRLVDPAREIVRDERQQMSGRGIDVADTLRRGQSVSVGQVCTVGKREFAQIDEVDRLQGGEMGNRQPFPTAGCRARAAGCRRSVRHQAEGRE